MNCHNTRQLSPRRLMNPRSRSIRSFRRGLTSSEQETRQIIYVHSLEIGKHLLEKYPQQRRIQNQGDREFVTHVVPKQAEDNPEISVKRGRNQNRKNSDRARNKKRWLVWLPRLRSVNRGRRSFERHCFGARQDVQVWKSLASTCCPRLRRRVIWKWAARRSRSRLPRGSANPRTASQPPSSADLPVYWSHSQFQWQKWTPSERSNADQTSQRLRITSVYGSGASEQKHFSDHSATGSDAEATGSVHQIRRFQATDSERHQDQIKFYTRVEGEPPDQAHPSEHQAQQAERGSSKQQQQRLPSRTGSLPWLPGFLVPGFSSRLHFE